MKRNMASVILLLTCALYSMEKRENTKDVSIISQHDWDDLCKEYHEQDLQYGQKELP